jgi:hypothetical protein
VGTNREHTPVSSYTLDPTERAKIAHLVTGAQANDSALERELRDAVYAVVERAKRRHTPPEQVLAQIKAAAREGVRAVDPEADALVKRVVGWCIRGYYDLAADHGSRLESDLPTHRAD